MNFAKIELRRSMILKKTFFFFFLSYTQKERKVFLHRYLTLVYINFSDFGPFYIEKSHAWLKHGNIWQLIFKIKNILVFYFLKKVFFYYIMFVLMACIMKQNVSCTRSNCNIIICVLK